MKPREFTGFHMALWVGGFFGVVIAVNVVLAVSANQTWTGLIVKNGYVASQEYNGVLARARDQAALGWSATLERDAGRLDLVVTGPDGGGIDGLQVEAKITRPIHEHDDLDVRFEARPGGGYVAEQALGPGQWVVDVTAADGADRTWRQVYRLWVEPEG